MLVKNIKAFCAHFAMQFLSVFLILGNTVYNLSLNSNMFKG